MNTKRKKENAKNQLVLKRLTKNAIFNKLYYVFEALIAVIFLFPILWVALTSLKPDSEVVKYPPRMGSSVWTLQNFVDIWHVLPFSQLYLNTFLFATSVTLISLIFDSMTAYAFARLRFRGSGILFVFILIMLMMPFQITVVPLFAFMAEIGLVNTLPGLIIPRATNAFGIFFLRQFFMSIPKQLEESARLDGANEFKIFRSITLPLSIPALLTLGMLHFQFNWNDLFWPLIMTNDASHMTLSAGLATFMGQHNIQYGLLGAGSVLAIFPIIIIFFLVQRTFLQGISTTGMK
jgi:multiple sugar transport system permease protein